MGRSPGENWESLSRVVAVLPGVPCLAGKPRQEFLLVFQGNLYVLASR